MTVADDVGEKAGLCTLRDVFFCRRLLLTDPCEVYGFEVESGLPGVHVWGLRVSDVPEPLLLEPGRCGLLSAVELARWKQLRFERDRRAYLTKRVLARAVLSLVTGCRAAAWEFGENEFGRPELAGGGKVAKLSFNVSRTGEMAICAVSRCARVGVDVEDTRGGEISEVGEQILGESERSRLEWMEPAERGEALYRFWTLKEAFLKGVGVGLTVPLHGVKFDLRGDHPRLVDGGGEERDVSWSFTQFCLMTHYAVALAVGRDGAGT